MELRKLTAFPTQILMARPLFPAFILSLVERQKYTTTVHRRVDSDAETLKIKVLHLEP